MALGPKAVRHESLDVQRWVQNIGSPAKACSQVSTPHIALVVHGA
jgi:hypothetical protein